MFAGMGAGHQRLPRLERSPFLNCQMPLMPWQCLTSPSHGENRGSSPLGSANNFSALEPK